MFSIFSSPALPARPAGGRDPDEGGNVLLSTYKSSKTVQNFTKSCKFPSNPPDNTFMRCKISVAYNIGKSNHIYEERTICFTTPPDEDTEQELLMEFVKLTSKNGKVTDLEDIKIMAEKRGYTLATYEKDENQEITNLLLMPKKHEEKEQPQKVISSLPDPVWESIRNSRP